MNIWHPHLQRRTFGNKFVLSVACRDYKLAIIRIKEVVRKQTCNHMTNCSDVSVDTWMPHALWITCSSPRVIWLLEKIKHTTQWEIWRYLMAGFSDCQWLWRCQHTSAHTRWMYWPEVARNVKGIMDLHLVPHSPCTCVCQLSLSLQSASRRLPHNHTSYQSNH